jgi:hypothetical protein
MRDDLLFFSNIFLEALKLHLFRKKILANLRYAPNERKLEHVKIRTRNFGIHLVWCQCIATSNTLQPFECEEVSSNSP